ncbi:hypothetical protein Droror1_Dr00015142 [Drosera rotundifolia]
MVKGYAVCGMRYEAWRVFMGMQGCGVKPSSFALSILVKVFDEMPVREVVSWNTMVKGYAACGRRHYHPIVNRNDAVDLMGSVDGSGLVSECALSAAGADAISVVNPLDVAKILLLFKKHEVIHFNKTDALLANNGLSLDIQKLRCHVNFHALKFTHKIEALGHKLIHILQRRGPFVALHLRYEMDMLAFLGCTHGCTEQEANELKRMRYAYPWWREKEINAEERRYQGLCPLTPEETTLVLKALGFDNRTQIYIASGEVYGSERNLPFSVLHFLKRGVVFEVVSIIDRMDHIDPNHNVKVESGASTRTSSIPKLRTKLNSMYRANLKGNYGGKIGSNA